MRLSDLVGHYTSAVTQSEPITKNKGVERLVSNMSELSKGNVFEGTVNSVKGKQVILGLSNGQQIVARLDGKISLVKGESMFFQVKSNDGSQVSIRPFTIDGSGANLTLLEALKAAGLPTGEEYLRMVNKMMQEQMPIGRNSLNEMAHLMQNHSQINVETLVQLQKLGLPITEEFAAQFENYLGDKQAIHLALDEFIDHLPQLLADEHLPADVLSSMSREILSLITEGLPEPELRFPVQAQETAAAPEQGNLQAGETMEQAVSGETVQTAEAVQLAANTEPADKQQEAVKAESRLAAFINGKDRASEAGVKLELQMEAPPNTLGSRFDSEQLAYLKGQLTVLFSKGEVSKGEEAVSFEHYDKNTSTVSVLRDIGRLLEITPNLDKNALLTFLAGDEWKGLIQDALEQQWTIRPRDMENARDIPEKINRLYEKIEQQLNRIEDIVKATEVKESNLSSLAGNIRSNVEFMKQINEAYTYVQIPLKMSGQKASGELYVYTNKKNLGNQERDLTAFLHLDLDHLGSTDVSVRLHKKDVTTNFYMDNEQSYAILKQFLPQLEEKLRAKGYHCKLIVSNEEKKVNFVEDFLKKDQPSAGQVHRYSFDMRA